MTDQETCHPINAPCKRKIRNSKSRRYGNKIDFNIEFNRLRTCLESIGSDKPLEVN